MPFNIIRQDITEMKVDAIVNAANTELKMGGGVCGAIFKSAGTDQLQVACDALAPIKTGEAVITPGFDLDAKFIIHAAGPIYREWSKEENERLLRSAYLSSLEIAAEHGLESIAFPLISSGIYGYPKDEALSVGTSTIQEFLLDHEMEVTLVVFDKASFEISSERLDSVERYIDDNYVDTHRDFRRGARSVELHDMSRVDEKRLASTSLDDLIGNIDEPFSRMLMRLIDAKGMTDVDVYKRANIDRRLFSKIRSIEGYMPSKRTAIALAIALELSLEETDELLEWAGYALSHAVKFDVIIEYFIINGIYDVFEINAVLFKYDQPLLGS